MYALVAVGLAATILVVSIAPRRWALLAAVGGVLYTTQGQAIDLFGFNFFAARFIELAAFLRVISKREFTFADLNKIDKIVLLLFVYLPLAYWTHAESGVSYQIGQAIDAVLAYFAFRGLVRNMEDLVWFLCAFALMLVPYVTVLCLERATGHNLFSFMGGPTEGYFVRYGHPRCMGSFRHPSLLGSLGATFLPIYIGAFVAQTRRGFALLGALLSLGIVLMANSGGPLNATFIGLIAWSLWFFRHKMRVLQLVFTILCLLAIFMKAPIWYLPAKFSALTGGGGYHRAELLDAAIHNIDKWWFLGMPLEETKDWFPYTLEATGAADMTNQYLAFGIRGGFVPLMLLVILQLRAFFSLGVAMSFVRDDSTHKQEALFWGLGALLASHMVNWFGIAYWDQFYIFYWLHFATIVSLTSLSFSFNDQSHYVNSDIS